MKTVKSPAEQKVFLDNVSWETYERLLTEREERPIPRFFYDRGMLEIVSLGPEHESVNRTISRIVDVIAEESDLDVGNFGSTTFRREDLQRGFEPDTCFYVQNEERVRGKTRFDFTIDPPPDLVIEIDITSPSIGRFPIYAGFGVPEVWRYDGVRVEIFELKRGEYVERPESVVLPPLTSEALTLFVTESKSLGSMAWTRRVREWARNHVESPS